MCHEGTALHILSHVGHFALGRKVQRRATKGFTWVRSSQSERKPGDLERSILLEPDETRRHEFYLRANSKVRIGDAALPRLPGRFFPGR